MSGTDAGTRKHAWLPEESARRLHLLHELETAGGPEGLWSTADRDWATKLARETAPPGADEAAFLAERARHACHRLAQRDPALIRSLQRARGRAWPALVAVGAGLLVGLMLDGLGVQQRINLLAPPFLGLLAWNLAAMTLMLWRTLAAGHRPVPGALRRALLAMLHPEASGKPDRSNLAQRVRAGWALAATPLHAQRAAMLLHLAAAAMAAGLIGGMYARGLAWDYRAGWESTFLEPAAVHALLHTLLAPASALTGIALPDEAAVAALRVSELAPAHAEAAPWLHLMTATLGLFVVLPRLALAALAGAAVAWRRRRFPVDLRDSHWQRLLRQWRHRAEVVQLLPHGEGMPAAAALGVRTALSAAFGDAVQLHIAPGTPYGAEEAAGAVAVPPGTTLRMAWVDLAVTPEEEAHGRFLDALRTAATRDVPLLLLADQSAWQRRFAGLPERLAQRRAAWQALADAHRVALVSAAFELQPAADAAAAALEEAVAGPLAPG